MISFVILTFYLALKLAASEEALMCIGSYTKVISCLEVNGTVRIHDSKIGFFDPNAGYTDEGTWRCKPCCDRSDCFRSLDQTEVDEYRNVCDGKPLCSVKQFRELRTNPCRSDEASRTSYQSVDYTCVTVIGKQYFKTVVSKEHHSSDCSTSSTIRCPNQNQKIKIESIVWVQTHFRRKCSAIYTACPLNAPDNKVRALGRDCDGRQSCTVHYDVPQKTECGNNALDAAEVFYSCSTADVFSTSTQPTPPRTTSRTTTQQTTPSTTTKLTPRPAATAPASPDTTKGPGASPTTAAATDTETRSPPGRASTAETTDSAGTAGGTSGKAVTTRSGRPNPVSTSGTDSASTSESPPRNGTVAAGGLFAGGAVPYIIIVSIVILIILLIEICCLIYCCCIRPRSGRKEKKVYKDEENPGPLHHFYSGSDIGGSKKDGDTLAKSGKRDSHQSNTYDTIESNRESFVNEVDSIERAKRQSLKKEKHVYQNQNMNGNASSSAPIMMAGHHVGGQVISDYESGKRLSGYEDDDLIRNEVAAVMDEDNERLENTNTRDKKKNKKDKKKKDDLKYKKIKGKSQASKYNTLEHTDDGDDTVVKENKNEYKEKKSHKNTIERSHDNVVAAAYVDKEQEKERKKEEEHRRKEDKEAKKREKEERVREAKEKREADKLKKDQDKAEREQREMEKEEKRKAEKERKDIEKKEKEQRDKEKREQALVVKERKNQEKAEKQAAERERKEQERIKKEQRDEERRVKEEENRERKEREKAEREQKAEEKRIKDEETRERKEREKAEKEQRDMEKKEKQKVEKEQKEILRKEKEERDKEKRERLQAEKERKEEEKRQKHEADMERKEVLRKEREQKEEEKRLKQEADQERREVEKKEKEQRDAEKKQKQEAERERKEAEKREKEQKDAERKQKQEAERERKEAEKREREQKDAEKRQKQEAERERKEQEKAEKAKIKQEKKEKLQAEQAQKMKDKQEKEIEDHQEDKKGVFAGGLSSIKRGSKRTSQYEELSSYDDKSLTRKNSKAKDRTSKRTSVDESGIPMEDMRHSKKEKKDSTKRHGLSNLGGIAAGMAGGVAGGMAAFGGYNVLTGQRTSGNADSDDEIPAAPADLQKEGSGSKDSLIANAENIAEDDRYDQPMSSHDGFTEPEATYEEPIAVVNERETELQSQPPRMSDHADESRESIQGFGGNAYDRASGSYSKGEELPFGTQQASALTALESAAEETGVGGHLENIDNRVDSTITENVPGSIGGHLTGMKDEAKDSLTRGIQGTSVHSEADYGQEKQELIHEIQAMHTKLKPTVGFADERSILDSQASEGWENNVTWTHQEGKGDTSIDDIRGSVN